MGSDVADRWFGEDSPLLYTKSDPKELQINTQTRTPLDRNAHRGIGDAMMTRSKEKCEPVHYDPYGIFADPRAVPVLVRCDTQTYLAEVAPTGSAKERLRQLEARFEARPDVSTHHHDQLVYSQPTTVHIPVPLRLW